MLLAGILGARNAAEEEFSTRNTTVPLWLTRSSGYPDGVASEGSGPTTN